MKAIMKFNFKKERGESYEVKFQELNTCDDYEIREPIKPENSTLRFC